MCNINIGYACITLGVPNVKIRTCRLKNASDDYLKEIIEHNLNSLEIAIKYNIENNIRVFRISSDIIPLASHPLVSLEWCKYFSEKIKGIGELIKKSGIRVSMHPGQYTVINSINKDVVDRSMQDLKYHSYFLDCLGVDETSKMVLHIGGIYGDKKEAMDRFIKNYNLLDSSIKKRLVIENDDVNYNIEDVLYISEKANIPVVFDNLHHEINPPQKDKSAKEWINLCNKTWRAKDGRQKIHYSQQDITKSKGAHSGTIVINAFKKFVEELTDLNIDIMLEVKDKNLSAIKCILCTGTDYNVYHLEKEWARYKYYILGKNPNAYKAIREMLKDKTNYIVNDFYEIIENCIRMESEIKYEVNAAQHVFGYFKKEASFVEKKRIIKALEKYKKGETRLINLKAALERLSNKYKIHYLLDSYYFIDI